MTVKHAPATPLPWRADPDGVVGQRSLLRVAREVRFLDDREYISHSGNAYPLIVAALAMAYAKTTDKAAREEIGALLTGLGEV